MDELERSLLNVFTFSDLNRMVSQRKDADRLASLQTSSSARYILFHQDQFLLQERSDPEPLLVGWRQVNGWNNNITSSVFLGSRNANHYFALDLCDRSVLESVESENVRLAGLRESGHHLKAQDASLLSYAKAMFHWHRAHAYCGVCGSAAISTQGGHSRTCTDSKCGKVHFPRTDPAIIVAVTRDDMCLFGRQQAWPDYRYSVIAGFVEPGESIEQAVVREVREETDIVLGKVHYHSSQPWPFPGSIMLGFTAVASSFEIRLNDGELQDAHWRNVDEVIDGLRSGDFRLPPRLSIAYRLIEDWFDSHADERLSTVMDNIGIVRLW